MMNNPHANIDRRRVADAVAREAPTNGGRGGPPTKRVKVDPAMTITSAELETAKGIRKALESCTQYPLNPQRWSDYDYAQQALTCTADLEDEDATKALMQRMYKLQYFREDYKIQDTVEEGVRMIQRLMEMMPGYLLSVDFAARYGSYIAVFDRAAFQPAKLATPEDMRTFLGAYYYIFQCLSTNSKAIRSGVVFITECQDMKEENFDLQVEEKFLSHLFGHYPFRHKECLWLNTPSVANIAYGLMKSLVPGDFRANWRMGCKLDGFDGRIDSLFKMPTLAIAQEQLLSKIESFLTERGQNAGGFELHQRMVYNPPPPPQPAAAAAAPEGQAQGAAAAAPRGQAAAVARAPARPGAAARPVAPQGPARQAPARGNPAAPALPNPRA